jgi:hypothetical protein
VMLLAAAVLLPHLLTGNPPPNAVKLPKPGVVYRPNIATATSKPWVDANGWRLQRAGNQVYYYDVPGKGAALAAAEAFAYGKDTGVHTDIAGAGAFDKMLAFLTTLGPGPETVIANIGVVDDGSQQAGEVMNLLARHNLLYRVEAKPDPTLQVNLSKPVAGNPDMFAQRIRQQVTDAARKLRIYGSDVVLGRMTGDDSHVRLHLINYGDAEIHALRVRVLGAYPKNKLSAFDLPAAVLTDVDVADGATEFTLPLMKTYAVVDLYR